MADQELLIVVRMRDEASAVLEKAVAGMRDLGDGYDDAAKKLTSFRNALEKAATTASTLSQTSGTAGKSFASLAQALTRAGATSGLLGNAMQTAATRAGALGQASGTAGGRLTTMFQALRGGAGPAQVAMVALEALIDLYGKAIDRTIQYEKTQNALNSAMQLSGGAIGMTKGAVNDVVNETASRTRTDDQELRQAAAQLINQGEVTSTTFKEALDVSTKLAFVMGTDVVSASRLVAQAMADPKRGMEALRDAGIRLKTAEMDRIEAMARSGDKVGAQVELLRAASEQAGSTEGATKGLSGAFRNLSHASGEFLNQFNDSVLSRITTGIVNMAAEAVRVTTIFEKRDTAKFLAGVEKNLADLQKRKKERGYWVEGEEAAAQAFERKIRELKAELTRISDEAARAVQKGAEAGIEKARDTVRRELAKKNLALDDAGNITSKSAIEADKYVEVATNLRDLLKKEYDVLERLSERGEVSAESFKRATQDLAGAERLLADAKDAAARATPERVAAKEAAEAEARKAAGLTQLAFEGLSDAITRMGTASNDVKSILFGTVDWLKSNTSKIAQSMTFDTFGWRGLPSDGNGPKGGPVAGVSFGGGGDTLKLLRDELARLNTTLTALPAGPYAVRKAEMELKASGVGSAEADLLRQTFGRREEIASKTAIDNLKEETELVRRLATAVGDVNKQNEIRRDFENARKLLGVAPEDRAAYEKALRDKDEATKNKEKEEAAYKEESDRIGRATAFARETFKGFFSDLKDGLKKGQGLWEAFGNAARNALNKITEKIVDLVSNKLLDQLFEGLGSAIGLGGSGKGGGAGGGGGGSGIFDFIGKGLKALATFLPFADGGIMTSRGPVPLRKYSGGGIATSPQLALFGEGSVPEAYVPVPSGRIPVELRGGGMRGGMTVQTNISVNMAAPADGQGSGGRGGNMMEQARELGAIVTAMVNKNLQDQMRPGGLLNPSGSFSAGVVQ